MPNLKIKQNKAHLYVLQNKFKLTKEFILKCKKYDIIICSTNKQV